VESGGYLTHLKVPKGLLTSKIASVPYVASFHSPSEGKTVSTTRAAYLFTNPLGLVGSSHLCLTAIFGSANRSKHFRFVLFGFPPLSQPHTTKLSYGVNDCSKFFNSKQRR